MEFTFLIIIKQYIIAHNDLYNNLVTNNDRNE